MDLDILVRVVDGYPRVVSRDSQPAHLLLGDATGTELTDGPVLEGELCSDVLAGTGASCREGIDIGFQ